MIKSVNEQPAGQSRSNPRSVPRGCGLCLICYAVENTTRGVIPRTPSSRMSKSIVTRLEGTGSSVRVVGTVGGFLNPEFNPRHRRDRWQSRITLAFLIDRQLEFEGHIVFTRIFIFRGFIPDLLISMYN